MFSPWAAFLLYDSAVATWGHRNASWSPWTRLAAVVVFAAAMAYVEGAVVYYSRKLFHVASWEVAARGRVAFPHAYLRVEQTRELATIVMVLAIGYLAGHSLWQKLAYFLLAFGVWDIGHYVSLKVLLGWPASPLTRDLLFLVPSEWWAPVWLPIAVSAGFIAAAVLIILRTARV